MKTTKSTSNMILLVIFLACLISISLTNSTNLQKSKLKEKSFSSTIQSKSLSDCSDVKEVEDESKANYIQATCVDKSGNSITSEIDLDNCFGNDNGQLECGGKNYSNSCKNIGILVKTVTEQEIVYHSDSFDSQSTYYSTKKKDGPYYLNAQCDKGKKKNHKYGWSYTNIYSCIKVSDGKLSC